MKIENIVFYHFSGTGNTLIIVKKMVEIFEKNGIKVTLNKFENSTPETVEPGATIGIAFPVAIQGTYKFIWDFLKKLPPAEKETNIFMVDTLANMSGGIVGPMKKLVQNKGYTPIGAKEFIMPNNFLPGKIDKSKNDDKIVKALEKAENFAKALVKGEASWPRVPLVSDFFSTFSKSDFMWNLMRKLISFKIDKTKCNKCAICSKICPVKNIEMADFPLFNQKCELCLRCISFCPKNAILKNSKKEYKRYSAVKLPEIMN